MEGRPLVFLDVETTGSSARYSRVLEIGALRVEAGKVVAQMNKVLDPEELVPGWITSLTGIDPSETMGQPRFADVVPELKALFKDAVFVAHNASFDYGFIGEEFRKAGEVFGMDRLCTVRLSRKLYPQYKTHKLDALIDRHGYRVERRHRAYDDAEVLHKFYHENLARLGAVEFYGFAEKLLQPALV
jgi:DNA polymerase-3 subunit epsilon